MRAILRILVLVGATACAGYFAKVDPRTSPEDKATCSPAQGTNCRPRDPRKPVQPGRTPADTFARDTSATTR